MAKPQELTPLQLAVMRVLWELGEATVAEVHRPVADAYRPVKPLRPREQSRGMEVDLAQSLERRITQSTVATVLHRLEKMEVVEHRLVGRQYVFSPVLAESEVRRSALRRVADRVFTGDVASLVEQLLAGRRVSREELAEVKALIEAKERELDEAEGA